MKQRKAKDDDGQRKVEQQLRAYFAEDRDKAEADLRLTELAGMLLYYSPACQQLAVDIIRACFKAWEAARDEYGHANLTHPHERAIVHVYHELLAELVNTLEPLPIIDDTLKRELEIYGAGADFQTKTAINKALKSGDRRVLIDVYATVSTYGTVKERKRKRA
jgi:hypothetical protein